MMTMMTMRRYKTGDACPFCGQAILIKDPVKLRLISLAASAAGIAEKQLPAPPESTTELLCRVYTCRSVGKNICCYACDAMQDCANACKNTPGRCNVWYKEGLK